MDEIQQYSAAEMERMMKVQDVLLKAMAKKITRWAAAEIIGVTDRTMRRWRERLEQDGYSGLADRRKGKPSAKRIPLATIEKRPKGRIALFHKADRSLIIKTGQLDLLTTAVG